MKLFLLERRDNSTNVYDCNDGFVIRAKSVVDARNIAAAHAADEGSNVWHDSDFSSCAELPQEGNEGIMLIDFHAG